MKYHEQSHPTPPKRVSLSWVTYTPSWEFPIPANLFPQNKQINSPLLLSFPPPKASSWTCYMALQPLFPLIPEHPLAAFCLISQKKQLWRQLDASPELSERRHSPKHHFPKPPHQQLFLTQPRAFPRAASTFICPHQNLWGRFCKIKRGTFEAEHELAVLEQPWSSSPLPMGEAGSIRRSSLQETPVYFNKNNNNYYYYCLCF